MFGDVGTGKRGGREIGDTWVREIGDACYIAEKRKKMTIN